MSGSAEFPETATTTSKTGFQPAAAILPNEASLYRVAASDIDLEIGGIATGVMKVGALFLEQGDGVVYGTFGTGVLEAVSREQ